jgi:hypothetical protein
VHRAFLGGRIRRAGLAAVLATLVVAAPVAADGNAQVTKGAFHNLAGGVTAGLTVAGDAVMVRTPGGRTLVVVIAWGLTPKTTYGAHVHKQACSKGDADGHYQFTPGGPADAVNEIWPGFTTNERGIGIGFAQNAALAGPEAVSVVIHAPGGTKLACADLT